MLVGGALSCVCLLSGQAPVLRWHRLSTVPDTVPTHGRSAKCGGREACIPGLVPLFLVLNLIGPDLNSLLLRPRHSWPLVAADLPASRHPFGPGGIRNRTTAKRVAPRHCATPHMDDGWSLSAGLRLIHDLIWLPQPPSICSATPHNDLPSFPTQSPGRLYPVSFLSVFRATDYCISPMLIRL